MKNKLISYIQNEILDDPNTSISGEDDLLGGGIVDSMGLMKMIGFIEETCQISVPPQDMIIEHFMTVDTITEYINSRQKA